MTNFVRGLVCLPLKLRRMFTMQTGLKEQQAWTIVLSIQVSLHAMTPISNPRSFLQANQHSSRSRTRPLAAVCRKDA